MSQPLIIAKTGSSFPALIERKGDFEDWIRAGLGVPDGSVEVVDVQSETELPAARDVGAVVITGSPAMVTDDLPWLDPTSRWIRRLVRAEVSVLGICFGHQLLARSIGGTVDWNPSGRRYGTIEVEQTAPGRSDPLLGPLPDRFLAHSAHAQSVRELPADSAILATSGAVGIQAFRQGRRAWGVQFHPEFSESIMRSYLEKHRRTLADEGADPDALLRSVAPSPAGAVLARFGEWFRSGTWPVIAPPRKPVTREHEAG